VELRDPDQDAGYVSVRNNKLECIRKIPLPTGWQIRSIPKMFLAENACDVFLELNSLTTPPFVLVKAALTQRRLDENEWTEVVGSVSHVWQHFTSGDFAIVSIRRHSPDELQDFGNHNVAQQEPAGGVLVFSSRTCGRIIDTYHHFSKFLIRMPITLQYRKKSANSFAPAGNAT